MTKKFWKFVNEDGCSPGIVYHPIRYSPGETIEVKDADPDPEIQCSSGIHCLDFSDEQYDDHNITFGPKVAILEVDEKDIIYYEKNGKCRVKKAKVLEVKEPELWMRTGNGNVCWAFNGAYIFGHHPDVMKLIIDSGDAYYSYYYALEVLKGHDERLMQVIINSGNAYCACDYAQCVIKEHDEKLMRVILDVQDPESAYYYAKNVLKGHDEILMEIANNDTYYKELYEEDILNKEQNND